MMNNQEFIQPRGSVQPVAPDGIVHSEQQDALSPEDQAEDEKIQDLQRQWLWYRCGKLTDEEVGVLAEKIAAVEPSTNRQELIRSGSIEEKRDVIIQEIVSGSSLIKSGMESEWFRTVFPNRKDKIIGPVYRVILKNFAHNSDRAVEQLDELYYAARSTKQ